MHSVREDFSSALRDSSLGSIPAAFSVAAVHQEIPLATLQAIDEFIRVFDRITNRRTWQERVTDKAPAIARQLRPDERAVLSPHVPPTWVLRPDNAEHLATRKHELVFKPMHGFAGRGLLGPSEVGRSRLRRLLRRGEGYVAQQRVERPQLRADGETLWADLRVWAHRGERLMISGRGSIHPDRLDLRSPGGWLPTYEYDRRPGGIG